MKTKFIFTDIHGNFLTFMVLVDKVAKEAGVDRQFVIDNMVVCGDLEDRGPRSRQIIQFCIDNKVLVVMGNHELMMLDNAMEAASYYMQNRWFGSNSIWTVNGGSETMESYVIREEDGNGLEKERIDLETLYNHLQWMQSLPLYLEFKDIKNEDGRHLVCSHSLIHNIWKYRGHPDIFLKLEKEYYDEMNSISDTKERLLWKRTEDAKKMWADIVKANKYAKAFETDIVWARPHKIKDAGNIYNVFGHTPQQNGARVRTIYSNIDTGCFYNGDKGYYQLTCLQFPEMRVTTHENVDNKE